MNRIRKVFAAAAIIIMMLSAAVYASDDNPVISVDTDNECVIIDGILNDARAGYTVGIRILKKGDEEYSFVDRTRTGKDPRGGYEFIFVPKTHGIFTALIYLPDEDKTIEKKFAYYSSAALEKMITELNNAKNTEDVKKLIIDNNIAFGISDEIMDKFSDKNFLAEGIYNFIKSGNSFSDSAQVCKTADKLLNMDLLNTQNDYSVLEKLIDSYTYSLIAEFKDVSGEAIDKRIAAKKPFANPIAVEGELRECIVLGVIESLNGYGDVERVLRNTAQYTGIDIEKYEKLSAKSQVMKAITGTCYKSFGELKKDFDDKLKETGNNSQSGGAKTGGGGSGGVYVPPTAQENNEPEETQPEKDMAFLDIDSSHWAWDYVKTLYNKGIINGKNENYFDPSGDITREEFVKMIVAAMGYNTEGQSCDFDDVPKDKWYFPYVSCAKNNGIISGVSENTFGVGTPIKRQDMFVIIYRVLLKNGGADVTLMGQMPFEDADDVSDYAKKALEAMYGMGILKGTNNCCNPHANAGRAEAAKVLCEIISKGGKSVNE